MEDAVPKTKLAARSTAINKSGLHFASIGDAMQSERPGARGTQVARSLNEGPRDDQDWKRLGERSRVLAECGDWLINQTPHKGVWLAAARAYRIAKR